MFVGTFISHFEHIPFYHSDDVTVSSIASFLCCGIYMVPFVFFVIAYALNAR